MNVLYKKWHIFDKSEQSFVSKSANISVKSLLAYVLIGT